MPEKEIDENSIQKISLSRIRPNPKQPRKIFNVVALEELASSIKEHGIIQPVVVRQIEGGYELVAGERRLRASKLAGLKEISAVIQNFNDKQIAEIALIENLQREDLNPIEEAEAYQKLIEEFGITQEQLSVRIGKSRPSIANTIRLLSLCKEVREMIIKGRIKAGQARPLLILDKNKQIDVANLIIEKGLNARQIEKYCKEINEEKKSRKMIHNPIIKDVENRIMESIGVNVKIKGNDNKGKVEIQYYDQDDLNRIIDILMNKG
ncbi:ParB/RepB/Spo0J family partition protein [Alkalicella caledoniensis]|uniref:ParB/RepB/Spo0J family partition protein n=2 Tax=Alkalicella caledoniensis TaxID=2731377 RepID=A0A7G9WD97_ALKCA|nr:ParB/RepB/Spo0J family partition protein [Alkalicella caledoniensis]